ncbi:hypothetical protein COP2_034062 [Malus domestica]
MAVTPIVAPAVVLSINQLKNVASNFASSFRLNWSAPSAGSAPLTPPVPSANKHRDPYSIAAIRPWTQFERQVFVGCKCFE